MTYTPPTKTYYAMDMLDYSSHRPDALPSLDSIASRVYGCPYHGQQTGDKLPNDSVHLFDMSDTEENMENLDHWTAEQVERNKEDYAKIKADVLARDGYLPSSLQETYIPESVEYSGGLGMIKYWQELPDGRNDFEKYRQAPEPRVILADLIRRGELPAGVYLLTVMW